MISLPGSNSPGDDFEQYPPIVGDAITVISGVFSSFEGTVVEVDLATLHLVVEIWIFGKQTPVSLAFREIKRAEK